MSIPEWIPESERARWTGLGDVVAAGTKAVGIPPCAPCKRRQAALNAATPGWVAAALGAARSVAKRLAAWLRSGA